MSDTADTGALDMSSASSAFEALENPQQEAESETPESAAERLAAEELQGKEEQSADDELGAEDGEAVAEPETVTIEVDGKPVQMTKAELAEAVKGQMRQSDYTQKTMAAAEVTKAAQAEKETASKERAELAQKLNVYTIQTQGHLQQIEAQLTEELLHNDPVGYMALERTLRNGQAQLSQAQQDLQQINQQQQAEQAQQRQAYQQSQHQALLDKLPDWKDPAKAQAEALKIQAYLNTQDFNGQELGEMNDHRLVVLARKAMMYDGLMERAGKATQKVVAAPPKVERPGVAAKASTSQEAHQKQMAKLGKSGKVTDAAAIFAGMM